LKGRSFKPFILKHVGLENKKNDCYKNAFIQAFEKVFVDDTSPCIQKLKKCLSTGISHGLNKYFHLN